MEGREWTFDMAIVPTLSKVDDAAKPLTRKIYLDIV